MVEWGFRGHNRRFGFEKMIGYSSYKPFVFRILTPTVANLLPDAIKDKIVTKLKSEGVWKRTWDYMKIRFNLTDGYEAEQLTIYLFMFGSLILFAVSLRSLTIVTFHGQDIFNDFAPVLALLLLPISFHQGGYMYDFPELFFVSVVFLFLLKEKWKLYYVFFILACINKESNVLLVLYFIAYKRFNIHDKSFIYHVILHLVIGSIVVIGGRLIFLDNPGSGAEFHLFENLKYYCTIDPYIALFDVYSPFIPVPKAGMNVLFIFLTVSLIFYGWAEKPKHVKHSFILMFMFLFPLFIVFGYKDEVRDFYLCYPPFYLLVFHSVVKLYNGVTNVVGNPALPDD